MSGDDQVIKGGTGEEPDDQGGFSRPTGISGFGSPESYGPPVSPPQGYGPPEGHSGGAGPGGYGGAYSGYGGGSYGPADPFGAPPPPPRTPPGPADPLRAAAVALLNLSGLGLGYLLLRQWIAMVVCWAATGALLVAALPADPDGVAGSAVLAYLAFLALAAVHGAVRGLRTRLIWPPRAPVAALLGLVLLAAPVGGVLSYDGARDEATQQMLLDRLDKADRTVSDAATKKFSSAQPRYRSALATYRDLDANHPGSRAARRVPASMKAYYAAVGAPYNEKKYCEAIQPLKYLRTVPDTFGSENLGALAGWPDSRLADSLYHCGLAGLGSDEAVATASGNLGELMTTFPDSPQAGKVEPAISSRIDKAAKRLKGDKPCSATDELRTLSSQATKLPSKKDAVGRALRGDSDTADKKVQAGTYACGVSQYKEGAFAAALETMNGFTGKYKHDKNRDRAQKIAIAAEIAQVDAVAGKHLPTSASGGSIPVTIRNDSPYEVDVLFTGPVTGSVKLKACSSCSTYSSDAAAKRNACKANKNYPKKTIMLPTGTTYFLHKTMDSSVPVGDSDRTEFRSGYFYTECGYVVRSAESGYPS